MKFFFLSVVARRIYRERNHLPYGTILTEKWSHVGIHLTSRGSLCVRVYFIFLRHSSDYCGSISGWLIAIHRLQN